MQGTRASKLISVEKHECHFLWALMCEKLEHCLGQVIFVIRVLVKIH